MTDAEFPNRSHVQRRAGNRGTVAGALLVLLGAWGVLIPFFGPQVQLAYASTGPWALTAARGWLQVLPGAVAIVGGVLLILSHKRFTALAGAWLAALAGAWFIVGRTAVQPLGIRHDGAPVATDSARAMWIELSQFTGLGAVILSLAALTIGRILDLTRIGGQQGVSPNQPFGRGNATPAH